MNYSAAVITVSDKGYRGERVDESGPMLVDMLKKSGFEVIYTNIIPDERDTIRSELLKVSDEIGVSLCLTTGGTGFSKRDITPEATMDVVEKETAGIPELMRAESAKITNRACLSRSKAGIRKDTLIINLPGSLKAAKENFEAISGALGHGMEMLLSIGSADCAADDNKQIYLSASTEHEYIGGDKEESSAATNEDGSPLIDMIFNENVDISNNKYAEKIVSALTRSENENNSSNDTYNAEAEFPSDDDILSEPYIIDEEVKEEKVSNGPSVVSYNATSESEIMTVPEVRLKDEYFEVPDDALVISQTYNGKKIPPKMDDWHKEAKADINAGKCGMYLTHNGVVRADAKSKVREGNNEAKEVRGMMLSYNPSEVKSAIEDAYQMDGIYYIKVWLNEGELNVGDDIMYVLVGGDIRANVSDALFSLVGRIKERCVTETELYD